MSWAKLDDDFHDHPKVEAVGNEGAGVIARLISWSSRHLTDGIVPLWKVMAIASNRKIQDPAVREESARTLVGDLLSARWLDLREGDNFYIHNYHKRNPSAAKEREKRAKDAERKLKNRGKSERSPGGTFASPGIRPSGIRADVRTESEKSHAVPVPVPQEEHTHSAGARVSESTQEQQALAGPTRDILAELRKHDVFEAIATEDLARQIAGDMGTGGKKLDWVIKAIDDAASKAKTARTLGKPFNADTLADKVVTFVRNSRAPRDASAGATSGQGASISAPPSPPYHAPFQFAPVVRSPPPQSMIDKFGKKPVSPPTPAPVEGDS